ncbi:uncharacterized protein trdc [Misgurnus anguillicaudatus]|uniref:uncharacterized protein trdc n=1 Tax=Misgurnus anguillicaudatus TaxID=75329 RepID=UPI003CCF2E2B
MVVRMQIYLTDIVRGLNEVETPLTFGDPIRLTVTPKDVPDTPPILSILSPVEPDGQDICLAAGFFPKDKSMILNEDPTDSLKTENAALSTSTKTYYYAGFKQKSITHCKIDQVEATPDSPVTGKDEKDNSQTPKTCPTNAPVNSPSVSTDTGNPKTNSMTLLVTGLRILLAKCVAINVLMSVKAFLV